MKTRRFRKGINRRKFKIKKSLKHKKKLKSIKNKVLYGGEFKNDSFNGWFEKANGEKIFINGPLEAIEEMLKKCNNKFSFLKFIFVILL